MKNIKNVCIVGNSGNVIGTGLGHLVDKCDVVIRLNDWETVGFEDDVGSKTTISCMNFQFGAKIPNRKDFPDLSSRAQAEKSEIWSARPLDGRLDPHVHTRLTTCYNWLGHNDIVFPTQEQWERTLKNAYVGFWRQQPSTGLIAIEMTLEWFGDHRIFLHGFDFNPTEKDHYFDDIKEIDDPNEPHNGHGHNWPGEIEYIKQLISQNRLFFLKN